jgi:hypothetical protein
LSYFDDEHDRGRLILPVGYPYYRNNSPRVNNHCLHQEVLSFSEANCCSAVVEQVTHYLNVDGLSGTIDGTCGKNIVKKVMLLSITRIPFKKKQLTKGK